MLNQLTYITVVACVKLILIHSDITLALSTTNPDITSTPTQTGASSEQRIPHSTSEPEVIFKLTSAPEGTSEQAPEPEATTETKAETTSESEGVSEVASDPEATPVPEGESEVSAEPAATSESEGVSEVSAESESTSKPEGETEVFSAPEATSEPEGVSEVSAEAEATSVPEGASEIASEPEATSEPEGVSEVSAEAEATSVPEGVSEIASEPEATSEPEGVSEVSAESESTSEPEGVSEVFSEPEATSEPEGVSEVSAESAATSVPEAVSEIASEPEATSEPEGVSEVSAEAEATSVPEGVSEIASEPEATSEPEGVSEVSAEPEATSEPEGVSVASTEPEATSEPEGVSEVSSEPEATSEPEGASEAESEMTSEPESSEIVPEVTAETTTAEPSAIEILLPPFSLIFVVLFAMIGLYLYSYCKKHPVLIDGRRQSNVGINVITLEEYTDICDDKPFLSSFDTEVITCFQTYHNKPVDLLKIAFPALLSLALCPLTLYMYTPFTSFVWPKESYPTAPDINDAIACFLAPAGLVYATSFGFAFQQALSKQTHILDKVTKEISMIDQIATFCTRINLPKQSLRRKVYRYIKSEIIFMILQILNRSPDSFKEKPEENVKIKIWSVIDVLREVNTDVNDSKTQIDRVLCEKIMAHIMKLNSICSDRLGVLHTKIHPVKWAFLETLGFFSFVGILLLKAFSYRMELVMCIITVFSISMLCFVVSDLDSPFSGFFRLDLSVLLDVVKRIDTLYKNSQQEDFRTHTETSSEADSMLDPGTPDLRNYK